MLYIYTVYYIRYIYTHVYVYFMFLYLYIYMCVLFHSVSMIVVLFICFYFIVFVCFCCLIDFVLALAFINWSTFFRWFEGYPVARNHHQSDCWAFPDHVFSRCRRSRYDWIDGIFNLTTWRASFLRALFLSVDVDVVIGSNPPPWTPPLRK